MGKANVPILKPHLSSTLKHPYNKLHYNMDLDIVQLGHGFRYNPAIRFPAHGFFRWCYEEFVMYAYTPGMNFSSIWSKFKAFT